MLSEKAMAPHSSALAWKIPWTEEPGRLQSIGSLRIRQDWATSLSLFTSMRWRRQWQPTPAFLPGESQGRGSLVLPHQPGGCRLWGRRVGHDWSDLAAAVPQIIKALSSSKKNDSFALQVLIMYSQRITEEKKKNECWIPVSSYWVIFASTLSNLLYNYIPSRFIG